MKLRLLLTFIFGVFLGSISPFLWQSSFLKPPTPIDIALGEILYEELSRYPKEYNETQLSRVFSDLLSSKRTPQPQEYRDRVLLDMCAQQAHTIAMDNLSKANAFLSQLAQKPSITSIDGKVYIEVLEEGSGPKITSSNAVSIYFKQYDISGTILKDTFNSKPSTIPLWKMIKGFQLGLEGACVGERRKIYIHPDYGFGKISSKEDTNKLLIYEVAILEKISP